MERDAGRATTRTGNTLAPSPGTGQVTPVAAPAPVATPKPTSPDGAAPEAMADAGSGPPPTSSPPAEPPPAEPSPAQPSPAQPGPTIGGPQTRPVLVGDVLFDSAYVGTQEGGERRGICGAGTVMVGVSFYYFAAGAGDRLGFLAPVCARFGDDPAAPLAWTRDDTAVFWPLSDVLLGDPPPPLAEQSLGELVCPAGLVVAGARGDMDPSPPTYVIRDITLECAPVYEVVGSSQLFVDRESAVVIAVSLLPFSGIEQYSIGCGNGDVASGLFESTGTWVDGFALSCSSLLRPRIAGDACSAGDACQSGVCDASGSCAAAP